MISARILSRDHLYSYDMWADAHIGKYNLKAGIDYIYTPGDINDRFRKPEEYLFSEEAAKLIKTYKYDTRYIYNRINTIKGNSTKVFSRWIKRIITKLELKENEDYLRRRIKRDIRTKVKGSLRLDYYLSDRAFNLFKSYFLARGIIISDVGTISISSNYLAKKYKVSNSDKVHYELSSNDVIINDSSEGYIEAKNYKKTVESFKRLQENNLTIKDLSKVTKLTPRKTMEFIRKHFPFDGLKPLDSNIIYKNKKYYFARTFLTTLTNKFEAYGYISLKDLAKEYNVSSKKLVKWLYIFSFLSEDRSKSKGISIKRGRMYIEKSTAIAIREKNREFSIINIKIGKNIK